MPAAKVRRQHKQQQQLRSYGSWRQAAYADCLSKTQLHGLPRLLKSAKLELAIKKCLRPVQVACIYSPAGIAAALLSILWSAAGEAQYRRTAGTAEALADCVGGPHDLSGTLPTYEVYTEAPEADWGGEALAHHATHPLEFSSASLGIYACAGDAGNTEKL